MILYLIDTKIEILLHSIPINNLGDAQRSVYYWKKQERERGYCVDRLLVYGGMSRLMDPEEPIPIPPGHVGQCLDARGVMPDGKVKHS
jgi:hypothetical protein